MRGAHAAGSHRQIGLGHLAMLKLGLEMAFRLAAQGHHHKPGGGQIQTVDRLGMGMALPHPSQDTIGKGRIPSGDAEQPCRLVNDGHIPVFVDHIQASRRGVRTNGRHRGVQERRAPTPKGWDWCGHHE